MPEVDTVQDIHERAKDRVEAICAKIRLEALTPAKIEAQAIVDDARVEAEKIKLQARDEAEKIIAATKQQLDTERQIFNSSLEQAAKQAVALLKQKIEVALFNPALEKFVVDHLGKAKENAKLIEAVIHAVQQDGIKANLAVKIAQTFTPEEIVANLDEHILKLLKNGAIELEMSDIKGGIKLVLKDKRITIDLSDTVLREIIALFVRKDFRKIFFTN